MGRVANQLQKGIAFAGTIAVDEIKKIEKYPTKSQLTTIKSNRRSNGGAVSNCAITMAKIDPDLPIEVITLIGEDERGEFLRERLEKYPNIDMRQVKVIGETPFTDVMQDETDHTRTFFTYSGNMALFDENSIDFQQVSSKILHIGYILLLESLDQEDAEYGTKLARVLKKAQDFGIKTSIDIVSENSNRYEKLVPPSLKYSNYCIVNEIEAGNSVGIPLRDTQGTFITHKVKEVLLRLKTLGVKEWVVIHAPEGGFGYDGERFYSIPSLVIEKELIKGTVGAGDAYVTGVLYGALQGMNLEQSMRIGTAAAASSLLAEDSTSGVRPYHELLNMYQTLSKKDETLI